MRDESVNGTIVGGNYSCAWITYDGRRQGPPVYRFDMTRESANKELDEIVNCIKNDLGDNFKCIYPSQLWQYHYDGL